MYPGPAESEDEFNGKRADVLQAMDEVQKQLLSISRMPFFKSRSNYPVDVARSVCMMARDHIAGWRYV